MDIINGNILLSDKDLVVQQVNCKGFMGKGLASSILERYPNVKKEYQAFRNAALNKGVSEEDLLGQVNFVDVYDGKIIANVFGQVEVRKNHYDKTVYTKKEALLKGIRTIEQKARQLDLSVAIPTYIGCGLAGGNWAEIKPEIEKIFQHSPVKVNFYHYR